MKICWWTVYPTVNQSAMLAALRARGVDVTACYFSQYDSYRRLLGWKDRPLEPWEHFAPTIAAARAAVPDWDERIQMVSSFADGISWRVMSWCRRRRKPWFVVTEGSRGRWFVRPALRLFARFVDRHALMGFFHGRAAAEQFGRLGVRASKRAVCTYPLPDLPADLPPRDTALTFVYAGVLLELKAVDVIAEAFRRVRAEFPHVRLLVVGDGELKSAFDGLDGVELVGTVPPDEVCRHLARGHVVLQPSRKDGWGLAILEGAACGLAMIGSDKTPSAVDRIVDGENGYIVPAGDADALAAAMRRYAADP
ncbi:MAG: glycosyltransferase family 4 protein, partial [Kiritimatiellae bacterium]|nr:glycosyltransferase family 4 protein [Kiritimatiellia bacterium]